MNERRLQPRMLCADLVKVQWRNEKNRVKRVVANLEDISLQGACLQLEEPIPLNVMVKIVVPNGQMVGKCRYCVYREIGYFIGIEFEADANWSKRVFKPQHLFDPRVLMPRARNRSVESMMPPPDAFQ
ncbi:MAG: PilZ domain-containing protein [Bryobacteraceae bacterium]|nr:PilZ domain-containing protein [Bryobacteraceae bacterium]